MKSVYIVMWEKWDMEYMYKAFLNKKDAEKYIETKLNPTKDISDFFYVKEIEIGEV